MKGYTVSLQVGQVAFAEGELARLFGCERKTIQRLVESMRALQLVSTNSTNRATVFTLLYLSGWLIEGNVLVLFRLILGAAVFLWRYAYGFGKQTREIITVINAYLGTYLIDL